MVTNRINTDRGRTARDRLLAVARRRAVVRPRDVAAHGVTRATFARLVAEGKLTRRGRGLYAATDAPLTEHVTLVQASARVPHGVLCLLSALRFHGLTTQNPGEVWLAIDHDARKPNAPELPLHIVRLSGAAFMEGVESHLVAGVPVRVYSPAKTVADCFKFRHKVGVAVALEALRDCWQQRRCTMDELVHYGRVCRVTRTMRPYLEALVAW